MAFTEQEKQIIEFGKTNNKTSAEIADAIQKLRAGVIPTPTSPLIERRRSVAATTEEEVLEFITKANHPVTTLEPMF